MLCRLCLLDCDDLIELFDEQGVRLNIIAIVEQHFRFELKKDDLSSKICTTCWLEIENFHVFFVDILRAQEKLNIELSKYIEDDEDELDVEIETNDEEFTNVLCEPLTENNIEEHNDFSEIQLLPHLEDCNINLLSNIVNIDGDLSNVRGDIDVFAAPSTTSKERRSSRMLKRKISLSHIHQKSQDLVVVDIETPEINNIGESLENMDECSPIDFCTVDYNNYDLNAEDEYISTSLNGHEKSDITKILERNEISITPMPDTTTEKKQKYYDEKISKYIKLTCEMCGSQFALFTELKQHFRDDHNISGYVICCNKKLFNRMQLLEHLANHINLDGIRLLSSDDKSNIKKETLENNFLQICQVCRQIFPTKKLYDGHLWEHQNEKAAWLCQQCGIKFKHRHSLQKHIRSHVDQNNDHICGLCGKKAVSDVSLHRHLKNVHYKERKYQCTLCEKAFKWSINLKEHMAIHTGKSLYKCRYCTKTFNASSNLHSHRKKIHPLEWEAERRKRMADEHKKVLT